MSNFLAFRENFLNYQVLRCWIHLVTLWPGHLSLFTGHGKFTERQMVFKRRYRFETRLDTLRNFLHFASQLPVLLHPLTFSLQFAAFILPWSRGPLNRLPPPLSSTFWYLLGSSDWKLVNPVGRSLVVHPIPVLKEMAEDAGVEFTSELFLIGSTSSECWNRGMKLRWCLFLMVRALPAVYGLYETNHCVSDAMWCRRIQRGKLFRTPAFCAASLCTGHVCVLCTPWARLVCRVSHNFIRHTGCLLLGPWIWK